MHPNDGRRIDRAVAFFQRTQTKLSDAQRAKKYDCRIDDLAIVYVDYDFEHLKAKIEARFAKMLMSSGMVREFETFYSENKSWIFDDSGYLSDFGEIMQSRDDTFSCDSVFFSD